MIIDYNTEDFPFFELICEALNVDDLVNLHESKTYDVLTRDKDQSTDWHKLYYNNNRRFLNYYNAFIEDIIKPLYDGDKIVYQKIPTFRVHLANNVAVGEWHKDKDYRDKDWAETVQEINYYLPFTNTNEHNTFWYESVEDKKDFSPALLNYGQILEWDGSNLTHGNKKNISNNTRVSVDFRVMPFSRYKESDIGSINMKSKFKIGGYYELC